MKYNLAIVATPFGWLSCHAARIAEETPAEGLRALDFRLYFAPIEDEA